MHKLISYKYTQEGPCGLLVSSSEGNSYDGGVQQFSLPVATHHQHPASVRRHTVATEQHRLFRVQQDVVSLYPYQGTSGTQGRVRRQDKGRSIDLSVRIDLQHTNNNTSSHQVMHIPYIHTYIHTYILILTYIHTYIHTHANIHTYIHANTYIHTHTHTYSY